MLHMTRVTDNGVHGSPVHPSCCSCPCRSQSVLANARAVRAIVFVINQLSVFAMCMRCTVKRHVSCAWHGTQGDVEEYKVKEIKNGRLAMVRQA